MLSSVYKMFRNMMCYSTAHNSTHVPLKNAYKMMMSKVTNLHISDRCVHMIHLWLAMPKKRKKKAYY